MFSYNEEKVQEIIEVIKANDKIAFFHHKNPDGDSISSSYGLLLSLKTIFPEKELVFVWNEEYLTKNYAFLKFNKEYCVTEIDETYVTVLGDSSVQTMMEPAHYEMYSKGKIKICFDHHQNTMDVNADVYWHEPSWIASAMQGALISKQAGVKHTKESAYFSAIGLLTDSGQFTYSLADSKVTYIYSYLLGFIDDEQMDAHFKAMKKRTKLSLEVDRVILENMTYYKRVVYLMIDKELDAKYGYNAFKFKINSLGNIEGYPVWCLISHSEDPEKTFDFNLRSNGPNVREVAVEYGGGGHIRACGLKVGGDTTIETVLDKLDKVIDKY